MTTPRMIPFGKPWITDLERQAVLDVLQGDILTHGPQSRAFESEFAEFLGSEAYCVSVSSGMAALHLSYMQSGIGPGDEVLVAAQTHVATAHAVEIVGARPVFVDCDPLTGNLDPDKLEALVTSRTRAIGLVHFLGIPCPMRAILQIADRHGLKVIEDCALALGARYQGQHVGLLGDSGCFSFYPVKHITTGDGGMFVTRHKALAEKVSKARAFGVDRSYGERTIPGMYDVPSLGLNYRMSDINASIGRKQLSRLAEILERRQFNFTYLKDRIQKLPQVHILDRQEEDTTSSHYCLSMVLKGPLAEQRNGLVQKLNQAGVGTSVYYPHPVPRLTYYRTRYGDALEAYPQAAHISDHSIALPTGPHLSQEDVEYIAGTVTQIVEEMLR